MHTIFQQMKAILYIKEVGGGAPHLLIDGVLPEGLVFHWDAKRTAHVREYRIPEDHERFRIEQEAIFRGTHPWPVHVDVETGQEPASAPEVKQPDPPSPQPEPVFSRAVPPPVADPEATMFTVDSGNPDESPAPRRRRGPRTTKRE